MTRKLSDEELMVERSKVQRRAEDRKLYEGFRAEIERLEGECHALRVGFEQMERRYQQALSDVERVAAQRDEFQQQTNTITNALAILNVTAGHMYLAEKALRHKSASSYSVRDSDRYRETMREFKRILDAIKKEEDDA